MSSLFINGQVVLCHSAVTRQDVCLICPAIVLQSVTVQTTCCCFCSGILQLSLQGPISPGQRYSTIGTVYRINEGKTKEQAFVTDDHQDKNSPDCTALICFIDVWPSLTPFTLQILKLWHVDLNETEIRTWFQSKLLSWNQTCCFHVNYSPPVSHKKTQLLVMMSTKFEEIKVLRCCNYMFEMQQQRTKC